MPTNEKKNKHKDKMGRQIGILLSVSWKSYIIVRLHKRKSAPNPESRMTTGFAGKEKERFSFIKISVLMCLSCTL